MIAFESVSFRHGETEILKGISFSIQKGEFVALVGANGAGKTTTAKLINGLYKPSSGTVLLDGTKTTALRTSALAATVGFLFQNPDHQLCKMTVREEIAFGLQLCGEKDPKARVDAVLREFELSGEDNTFALSRGERQRVALASVLAAKPAVLILDEPTTGLDYRECMKMMRVIQKMNETGITVVMVCHDMELVLDFAKRVIVLKDGEKVLDGETRAVFRETQALKKASVLPPQIMRLSARLSDLLPPADTVEAMEAEIRRKAIGKEAAS